MSFLDALKRALVGTAVATGKSGAARLSLKKAAPALSANGVSSLAYAPDEILYTLAAGGVAAVAVAPWVGAAVAGLTLVLVAAYRLSVRQAPGQGDYQIARKELGTAAGSVVGAALLLDLTLTVAVSMAVAASYITVVVPSWAAYQAVIAVVGVIALVVLSLRGWSRSVRVRVLSVYLFLGLLAVILIAGSLTLLVRGHLELVEGMSPTHASATSAKNPDPATGWAAAILVLRAFSTGSAAVTGLETPVTHTALLRPPRAKNAGRTLLFIGVVSMVGMLGILLLARFSGVAPAAAGIAGTEPGVGQAFDAGGWPTPVTVLLAQAVVGAHWPAVVVAIITTLILLGAGMSAFASFPRLAFHLAQDDLLPRQLRTRGERLVFSNGIMLLGACAGVLVVLFQSRVTELIQLYVVGIFVVFVLGQAGLARRANAHRRQAVGAARRRDVRHMIMAGVAAGVSALVLLVILATRLLHGAWLAFIAIAVLSVLMVAMRRHYRRFDRRLAASPAGRKHRVPHEDSLPSRVHAVVLASNLSRPVHRALAYARAMRPAQVEALLVDTEAERTERFLAEWEQAQLPVRLTVLASPYRDVAGPLIDHVRRLRADKPREIVAIFVPEYVVEHGWERLVHNQTLARLHSRLRQEPAVVIATVPWQIGLEQDVAPGPEKENHHNG